MGFHRKTYNTPQITMRYMGIINMMKRYGALYGEEERRAKAHEELCEYYGLTKEETQKITFNIPDDWNAIDLHLELMKLVDKAKNSK